MPYRRDRYRRGFTGSDVDPRLLRELDAVQGGIPYPAVDADLRDFGGIDSTGNADCRTALASADRVATGETIVVPPGTYRVNSDLTISNGLWFQRGAMLKPASGVTLTLNGPLTAGRYQIFDESLGGVIRGLPVTRPVWWGATYDGTTNDSAAFQAAIDAAGRSGACLAADDGVVAVVGGLSLVNKAHFHFEANQLRGTGTTEILKLGDSTAGNSGKAIFSRIYIGKLDGVDKTRNGIRLSHGNYNDIHVGYIAQCDKGLHIEPEAANAADNIFYIGLAELCNDAIYAKGGSVAANHAEGITIIANFIANNGYGIRKVSTGTGSLKYWTVLTALDFNTTRDIQDDPTDSDSYYLLRFVTTGLEPTGAGLSNCTIVDQKRRTLYLGDSAFVYNPAGASLTFRGSTTNKFARFIAEDGGWESCGANPFWDAKNASGDDYDARIQAEDNATTWVFTTGGAGTAQLQRAFKIRDPNGIADGDTGVMVLVRDGSTYTLANVTVGADDSGGAGYKLLRVPN